MRFIILLLIVTSCSASYHIKRARKLDSSLFETESVVEIDTIVIETPLVKERVITDTVVQIVQLDPITKIKTIVKYEIKNDSIMIDCPDSEVVVVKEVVKETVFIEPTTWEKIQFSIYFIVLISLSLLALKFFKS